MTASPSVVDRSKPGLGLHNAPVLGVPMALCFIGAVILLGLAIRTARASHGCAP